MATYGTIPSSSSPSPSPNLEYISRVKDRIKSDLSTRQPWTLVFNPRSFSLPVNFPHTLSRVKTNLSYFRVNYAIIVLLILFLSLLWLPISLIVFIITMAAWLFLYFLRDDPLVVFGRVIDDRLVLGVLSVLTIVLLLLTHATVNILVALPIGAVVVVVHAAVRRTEDLYSDEEAVGFMSPRPSPSS